MTSFQNDNIIIFHLKVVAIGLLLYRKLLKSSEKHLHDYIL